MDFEYDDIRDHRKHIKLALWAPLLVSLAALLVYTYPGLLLADGAYLVNPADSGSTLPGNTLVFTRPASMTDILPGDIVTYRAGDDPEAPLYTREVLDTRVANGTNQFRIAPDDAEEWVSEDNVYREVVWSVPLLGQFIAILHTFLGVAIFIIFPAALLATVEVSEILDQLNDESGGSGDTETD